MAAEVHQFSATIPAGTPMDSPVSIPLEQANYEIESIDLEVPPGPSGLVGFVLALDDTQWLPWELGEYIIWNDRTENWPLNDQVVNGGWNIVGYNLGVYDHTVTIRFHVNPLDIDTTAIAPTLTIISNPPASASAVL